MDGTTLSLGETTKASFINNHVKIIANGVDITAGGSFTPTPSPNPDVVQYVCENGYKFDGDVYMRYRLFTTGNTFYYDKMTDTSDTVKTFTLSERGSFRPICEGTFTKDGVTLSYMQVVQDTATVYQLTKNLTNASVTPNITTVIAGNSYTLEINANEGYTFDENNTPSFYYIDNEGDPYYLPVTKIDDTHYRITFTADETDYILDASAVALPATTPIDITGLTHCHISPNILAVTVGVTTQIDVVADSGYYFNENDEPILYIPYDNEGGQTTVNGTRIDETTYRFSVTTDENDIKLEFVADAVQIPATTPLTKNLTNCSVTPNVNSLIDGETYSFIFTADSGYIFDVAPSLRYHNSEGDYITCPLTKISDYEYRYNNLTIDADDMTAFYATAYASVESVSSNKYGVLQIHKVSADNLKAFNDLRYYGGSGSLQQIDLSQYISALKVVFVDVASTANDNILVSNINTGISAPKIDDDYITLNLGNVLLAGLYNNALDKKYSEILLNLPFVDVYKLDSVYMNETINIKYRVNLISGDGAIFISIVRNSVLYLIDVINVSMSFDLPYIYPIESDIKQLNTKIKAVNFNIAPSVTIKERLKADANNSVYQCYKIDTPANENGYFKIERLDADTIPASASIRNKIENLLKAGVYI